MGSNSVVDTINLIILGGLLGAVGQGIRVVVGLKKLNDQAAREHASVGDLFSPSTLLVSLLVGFIAGVIGVFTLPEVDPNSPNARAVLLPLLGVGYAGADFIEGFVKKHSAQFGNDTRPGVPKQTQPESTSDQPAMG